MTVPAGRTALFPIGPTAPLTFAAGSPERASVGAALKEVRQADYDVANVIGGHEVRTGRRAPIVTPHEHARQLGHVHYAGAAERPPRRSRRPWPPPRGGAGCRGRSAPRRSCGRRTCCSTGLGGTG